MNARRSPRPSRHFTLERLADGVYAAIHADGGTADLRLSVDTAAAKSTLTPLAP